MPLLACKDYVGPILIALRGSEQGLTGSELSEQVAQATQLTASERSDAISDGTPKYVVRIKQARYWLKNQGYVESKATGNWLITVPGSQFLENKGGTVDKLRRISASRKISETIDQEDLDTPPLEIIDLAVGKIRDAVRSDLLQRLRQSSPIFFERLVLELLKAMGYAGVRGDVKHTGGPGDGGIDGIVHSDRLGLERVYVQAKRWSTPVGSPELQSFCGALSIYRAQKGVMITTASFTSSAQDHASKAPQAIRLIEGAELTALMVEFGIGVSREKAVVIPHVDKDYFDE